MASKRAIRRKLKRTGCDGKAKHRTEADAMIAIQKTPGYGLVPYKCGICGFWHIGHKEKKYGKIFIPAYHKRTVSLYC